MLQEIIQDAKTRKKTVHISWYNLTDAFGSVIHKLIEHCLKHYYVSEAEIMSIMNLYSKLKGRIVTKEWATEIFDFCRGIFTGDNYLPIIFNVFFQPLIDFIKKYKESYSYKLGSSAVITKPFADDFELLTNRKDNHQKLQDLIQKNAATMGLTFKPSKCRSLSIYQGKRFSVLFFHG